jgi:hypothetical protein
MGPAWIARARIDRARAVALADVLTRCGARPDSGDRAKWHSRVGPISVNGMKFMNWTSGRGGGGAIDLAMHLLGMDFREATQWLLRNFPCSGGSENDGVGGGGDGGQNSVLALIRPH